MMSDDYEVGYGKPPRQTRFKKGQSGNPKGRPKGSKNMGTLLGEVLAQKVTVMENGQNRRIPYKEAFVRRLAAKGIEGSTRDMLAFAKALDEHLPDEFETPKEPHTIVLEYVLPEGKTVEDYESQDNWMGRDSAKEKENKKLDSERNDDDSEAAWRASGIDDEAD
jgi:hypothetical protein